ncbi:unnamed protein product, partial [Closterium sp. NIES-53]
DPTSGFLGDRHFASAADEADWDEQNVDNASDEAGPLPYCSVPISMDDENPRESVNAETYFDLADTGYVTPAEVNTNEAERVGLNFIPDLEAGDEAAYPADITLPRYTPSGLQILGLVTARGPSRPLARPLEAPQAPLAASLMAPRGPSRPLAAPNAAPLGPQLGPSRPPAPPLSAPSPAPRGSSRPLAAPSSRPVAAAVAPSPPLLAPSPLSSRRAVEPPSSSSPGAEPPDSRAAQSPSRPVAEPTSRRAAPQLSRPAAEQQCRRAAQQPSRCAAPVPAAAPRPYLLGLVRSFPVRPLQSWLPLVSLPLMLRVRK